jgi:hypothetical protein
MLRDAEINDREKRMLKRGILKLAVAAAITSALTLTGVAASGTAYAATTGARAPIGHSAAGALAAADIYGCDSGWVCIITKNDDIIVHAYFTYGAHNIANPYLFGSYIVDNNQTGGAAVALCTGSDGAGCGTFHNARWVSQVDMTPINSVVLRP